MDTWIDRIDAAQHYMAHFTRPFRKVLRFLAQVMDRDWVQLAVLALLSVIMIGAVYYVNLVLGYQPQWGKAVRTLAMVLLVVPHVLLLRTVVNYRGRIRLLLIAATLLTIGLSIRYDYETKRDYNNTLELLRNDETPEAYRFPTRGDLVAFAKLAAGYVLHFLVFLLLRKRPRVLQRRIVFMAILASITLVVYGIFSIATNDQFAFGTTPWDLITPLLVLILAGFLVDNVQGLSEIRPFAKRFRDRPDRPFYANVPAGPHRRPDQPDKAEPAQQSTHKPSPLLRPTTRSGICY
jgi:hypothetical protein